MISFKEFIKKLFEEAEGDSSDGGEGGDLDGEFSIDGLDYDAPDFENTTHGQSDIKVQSKQKNKRTKASVQNQKIRYMSFHKFGQKLGKRFKKSKNNK